MNVMNMLHSGGDRAVHMQAVEIATGLMLGRDIAEMLLNSPLTDAELLALVHPEHRENEARMHAVWCVRKIRTLLPEHHRSTLEGCLLTAWRHARGRASEGELDRARDEAYRVYDDVDMLYDDADEEYQGLADMTRDAVYAARCAIDAPEDSPSITVSATGSLPMVLDTLDPDHPMVPGYYSELLKRHLGEKQRARLVNRICLVNHWSG